MKDKTKKIIYWLPAFLWMIVIFIVGSVRVDFKGDNINLVSKVLMILKDFLYKKRDVWAFAMLLSENLDRVYHTFEYSILTLLVYYALKKTEDKTVRENAILTSMFVLIIGILDELHQIFIPTRFCSFFDLLADGIGISLMIIFILIFQLSVRRRNAV